MSRYNKFVFVAKGLTILVSMTLITIFLYGTLVGCLRHGLDFCPNDKNGRAFPELQNHNTK